MQTKVVISSLFLLAALLLPGCRARGPQGPAEAGRVLREFPYPEIPAVYVDPAERRAYLADHFWDRFLAGEGPCDTGAVLGVARGEVEQKLSNYISLLAEFPLPEAQRKVRRFFSQVEARQAADTASLVYLQMEELVTHYLYDPNSPMRSEDLYLPYVDGLADSPFTREAARPGYEYQREMCALAQTGTEAPDFRFTDVRGRTRRLRDIRADATLLFFSNPGCHACQEIIGTLTAVPGLDAMIADGRLAVVNVYIDEEIGKWREYEPNYPRNWLNGYDPDGLIRSDRLYNIRAIPSLWLLDGERRILLKDAPVERVASWLQNRQNR
ncbi:MAG: DUF5106 domain-containing protein [Bacteroidales bacterium]|nr:DUF5106 domain-containing protein [Bacteroidales bacterium]